MCKVCEYYNLWKFFLEHMHTACNGSLPVSSSLSTKIPIRVDSSPLHSPPGCDSKTMPTIQASQRECTLSLIQRPKQPLQSMLHDKEIKQLSVALVTMQNKGYEAKLKHSLDTREEKSNAILSHMATLHLTWHTTCPVNMAAFYHNFNGARSTCYDSECSN